MTGGTRLAAGTLGFALGGFFDGILLHQILQWHHLLSLVPGEAMRDLRVQVLADGLFHLLVYLIAMLGLWRLWRGRAELGTGPGAGRPLLGAALLGFALWHGLDAVAFHWLLGLHRIRVDVPDPLAWDLGWLVVFGVVPMLAGLRLRRRAGGSGGDGGSGGRAVAALLVLAVLGAAPVAALPPRPSPGADARLVLFRPGLGPDGAVAAVLAAGGRVVWVDAAGDLAAVDLGPAGGALRLYRHGALMVGHLGPAATGCLAWSRASRRTSTSATPRVGWESVPGPVA